MGVEGGGHQARLGSWERGSPGRAPLADPCLSLLPSCPRVSVPASAGPVPPWTVAASPTFSSPRPPCRLSGPPVTGLDLPHSSLGAAPSSLSLTLSSICESLFPDLCQSPLDKTPSLKKKNLARNFLARSPCHLPAETPGSFGGWVRCGGGRRMRTADGAEVLCLCHAISAYPGSAAERVGHRAGGDTRPGTMDRWTGSRSLGLRGYSEVDSKPVRSGI